MKKSLLAVAAIGAFASAAQAQSSVTVYGILDVGFSGTNSRIGGTGNAAAPGAAVGSVSGLGKVSASKTTTNGFAGNGNESTSRLGFKGTEDLGGGASAFFTVELAITPNSDQVVSTAATQNRQAFVGLKKNGIGAASIGTQYTPIHLAVAATDPGQQNNVVGNVIYPNNTSTFGQPGANNTGSYTVRASNSLFAKSDKFAGFEVSAMYIQNNSTSTVTGHTYLNASPLRGLEQGEYTGGVNNQQGWALGANYTWNKLFVTANYQSLNSKNPYGADAFALGTNGTTNAVQTLTTYTGYNSPWINASGGSNVKDNQQYYGATYDFGILKAYAGYVNRKATSQYDSSVYANRSAQQIGVRSYITPTVEAWASAGTGRMTTLGNNAPTANFNGWQLGSNYYLSKRTNLYAIYGQTVTSTANFTGTVSSGGTLVATGVGTINSAASQYALGVRHTF